MKIDTNSAHKIVAYLKEGNVCYIRSNGDYIREATWEVSYDESHAGAPIICRDITNSEDVRPYKLDAVIGSGFWGYSLVNIDGEPMSFEEYAKLIRQESKQHPHYDLIVQWAADPKNVVVEFKTDSEDWTATANPDWIAEYEYRIIPKVPTIYRQVFFKFKSDGSHHLSVDKYATLDEFSKDCEHATPIGWYDATAEERF